MSRTFSLVYALLLACDEKPAPSVGTETIEDVDNDGDGYLSSADCDDSDPLIKPNATESCDGIDNDCDGVIDEDLLLSFFPDVDEDGFGDPNAG